MIISTKTVLDLNELTLLIYLLWTYIVQNKCNVHWYLKTFFFFKCWLPVVSFSCLYTFMEAVACRIISLLSFFYYAFLCLKTTFRSAVFSIMKSVYRSEGGFTSKESIWCLYFILDVTSSSNSLENHDEKSPFTL